MPTLFTVDCAIDNFMCYASIVIFVDQLPLYVIVMYSFVQEEGTIVQAYTEHSVYNIYGVGQLLAV